MNEAANRGGMIVFIFSMVFSFVFFGVVMFIQPGPIDIVKIRAQGLTADDLIKRREEWAKSTPEKIEEGRKLFKINFDFQMSQSDFEKLTEDLNGKLKDQTSEIRLFNLVSNGFQNPSRNKNIYIPEFERWEIALYLRSLVKNPAEMNKQEWDAYRQFGL